MDVPVSMMLVLEASESSNADNDYGNVTPEAYHYAGTSGSFAAGSVKNSRRRGINGHHLSLADRT